MDGIIEHNAASCQLVKTGGAQRRIRVIELQVLGRLVVNNNQQNIWPMITPVAESAVGDEAGCQQQQQTNVFQGKLPFAWGRLREVPRAV